MKNSQIYNQVLDEMSTEFFSSAPEDRDKTIVLKTEWAQNIRSKRNISSSLYKYRWQFLPKEIDMQR